MSDVATYLVEGMKNKTANRLLASEVNKPGED